MRSMVTTIILGVAIILLGIAMIGAFDCIFNHSHTEFDRMAQSQTTVKLVFSLPDPNDLEDLRVDITKSADEEKGS